MAVFQGLHEKCIVMKAALSLPEQNANKQQPVISLTSERLDVISELFLSLAHTRQVTALV